jgi:uridine phosphorylase
MEQTLFNSSALDIPVYTAQDMLMHRWNRGRSPGIQPPEAIILTYQPSLMDYALKEYSIQKVGGFFGDLYMLKHSGGKLGIAGNFGIGAPAAAVILEELAAFGVRQFISVGLAGGLQPWLTPGSVVLIDSAYRDEGTSAHYSSSTDIVRADTGILDQLKKVMETRGIPIQVGTSWTTDAPYRETWKTVGDFRKKGMLTVEMEAAAVFSVGQALKIQVGAAVVVADPLLRRSWNTTKEEILIGETLQKVLNSLVAVFLKGSPA